MSIFVLIASSITCLAFLLAFVNSLDLIDNLWNKLALFGLFAMMVVAIVFQSVAVSRGF